MSGENPISLLISFQDLPDPRVEGRCDHKRIDIIVITVCAVIVGAESWVDIAGLICGRLYGCNGSDDWQTRPKSTRLTTSAACLQRLNPC